ncbi:uncharacterized protein TRAVEDRAFT_49704 [Trametes versicolor FP-101664 SS1]|uniref:uncharacterized protein n=1 Tax=Trametes versicolor (strain FP-101664) TaxID=717944 RepID=UPI0004621717|nr:uncharacterized protein TRAVEDRAFT_49704 [Trametes versicolor FP-101664 SS1]EIW56892.1 hypothetical protein TRAVEDRAFT_49704 [Trametes versicolor FP-101664 SS1]
MTSQAVRYTPQPAHGGLSRTRDAEFWFDDGNIVLLARGVEFRIYKGILAEFSPVFHDMFSFPQPTPTVTTSKSAFAAATDPCPIVDLPDSPEDLRHILRVCMPKSGSSLFKLKSPSYHMISAIIRLGHKYQMDDLVNDAVDYLKRWYTFILEEWAEGRLYAPDAPFEPEKAHAIGVVNLARLVDEPLLLPSALLMCCSLNCADIVKGFTREDGTREMLSLDDIGRCFAARTKFSEYVLLFLVARTSEPLVATDCAAPAECQEAL